MCYVAIPAIIGLVVSAAAAATSTALSVKAQNDAGDFQQRQAENNAALARYQQADAEQRGAVAASKIREQGSRVAAQNLTMAAAKGGVDTTSGSMANLLEQSQANAAADAAVVRANAARAAWGLGNEAADTLFSGQAAKRASILGSLGTGIGGTGQAIGGAMSGLSQIKWS